MDQSFWFKPTSNYRIVDIYFLQALNISLWDCHSLKHNLIWPTAGLAFQRFPHNRPTPHRGLIPRLQKQAVNRYFGFCPAISAPLAILS